MGGRMLLLLVVCAFITHQTQGSLLDNVIDKLVGDGKDEKTNGTSSSEEPEPADSGGGNANTHETGANPLVEMKSGKEVADSKAQAEDHAKAEGEKLDEKYTKHESMQKKEIDKDNRERINEIRKEEDEELDMLRRILESVEEDEAQMENY